MIHWFDPFAWSKIQVIPFVYWFGVWIIVIPLSKLAFWKSAHPKMRDLLEGSTIDHNWLHSINVAYSSSIPTRHRSSLTKPSPCLVHLFNITKTEAKQGRKNSIWTCIHTFHQKKTKSWMPDNLTALTCNQFFPNKLDQSTIKNPTFHQVSPNMFVQQHTCGTSSESVASVSPVVLPFGCSGHGGCWEKTSSCNWTDSLIPCAKFLNPGKHLQKTATSFWNTMDKR